MLRTIIWKYANSIIHKRFTTISKYVSQQQLFMSSPWSWNWKNLESQLYQLISLGFHSNELFSHESWAREPSTDVGISRDICAQYVFITVKQVWYKRAIDRYYIDNTVVAYDPQGGQAKSNYFSILPRAQRYTMCRYMYWEKLPSPYLCSGRVPFATPLNGGPCYRQSLIIRYPKANCWVEAQFLYPPLGYTCSGDKCCICFNVSIDTYVRARVTETKWPFDLVKGGADAGH